MVFRTVFVEGIPDGLSLPLDDGRSGVEDIGCDTGNIEVLEGVFSRDGG